jgi:hypothetical protein
MSFSDFSPQTQQAFKELFAAIEKQYGPIEYFTMCSNFEDSEEFKRVVATSEHPEHCLCDECAAMRIVEMRSNKDERFNASYRLPSRDWQPYCT